MAAIWKGSVTFGLVSIPVELRAAVKSDHISFRLLHAEDLAPVRYERVCEEDGEPLSWDEIVKGYEYQKGKFVVLSSEDFEAAALESSDAFDLLSFAKAEEIDPRLFEKPYYLVPTKGGARAYAVLRDALKDADVVGVGKIIIRQKQHLAGIKVVGNALMLELMRFSEELVDAREYALPASTGIRPEERKMAKQLVESLTEPFDPEQYTDEYRANLMRVIRAKAAGKKPKLRSAQEPDADDKVIDLMERLQQSLGAKGGRAAAKRAKSRSASSRGAARGTARGTSRTATSRRSKTARRKSA